MSRFVSISTLLIASTALAACGGSGSSSASRDQIRAVGSSTVYPFAKAVAEALTRGNPAIKSPIVESTGTGAGMKLFCAGVGTAHPDIEDASRRMKKSEFDECVKNGVTDIAEIQVGLDGIAFTQAASATPLTLSVPDIYKALAANPFGKPNTAKTWHDVNPALPATPIMVYGPPTTSGTRDALAELILTKGCETDPAMKALKDKDKDQFKKFCTGIREDGAYVDAGENDNLIVQKLESNPQAVGIFGYSYLEANATRLHGITVGGLAPTYASISDFSYPGARPLYIYVKKAHLASIHGIKEYVAEWAKAWGPDGYLKKDGMVISPDAVRTASATAAASLPSLDGSTLK